MRLLFFIFLIFFVVFPARRTGSVSADVTENVLLPLRSDQELVQSKMFLVQHQDLARTDKIESFLASPSLASYKKPSSLVSMMYQGPLWFRLDFFSSLPRAQKIILANDRPIFQVSLVDYRGQQAAFKPTDYRLHNTVKPFFEIEVPPGYSTTYLRVDTSAQASTLAWRVWSPQAFINSNLSPENGIVLWVAPVFLCFYLGVFFMVLGSYQFGYAILADLGLLGVTLIVGGNYPLSYFPEFYAFGAFVPAILALSMLGHNEFFRYCNEISRKRNPYIWAVLGILSCCHLLLASVCTLFPHWSQGWMLAPAVFGGGFHLVCVFLNRGKPGFKMTILYVLSIPTFTVYICLVFQYLGMIPYFPELLDYHYLAIVFFQMTLSVVFGVKVHRQRIAHVLLKQDMLLGQSVQELFIPPRLELNASDLDFRYRYLSHYGMMSGDWVKHWQTQDGKRHFVIGDVSGTGPQAAIAVSVIAMTIHLASRHDQPLEDCLRAMNSVLFRTFSGKMTTTATGVTVSPHHRVFLYNAGGTGCYKISGGQVNHLLSGGAVLGLGAEIALESIESQFADRDIFVSMTDGFAPFHKPVGKMLRQFASQSADRSGSKLIEMLFEKTAGVDHKDSDDKAVMVIEKK